MRITKKQKEMRELGSSGGKKTVRRYGKKYMRKLALDGWIKRKAKLTNV